MLSHIVKGAAVASLMLCTSANAALLVHYNFNGQTLDQSGLGNNGTIVGNPTFTASGGGRTGLPGDQAMIFDGSGDAVSVSTAAGGALSSITSNNQATISLWQRATNSQQPRADTIFSSFPAVGGGNRILQAHLPWSDNTVYWDANANNGCCSGVADRLTYGSNQSEFASDVWHHWAFVKDGVNNTASIYFNGILKATTAASTDDIGAILSFFVGSAFNGGESYLGQIDDFAVFNTALSGGELARIAAGGALVIPEPASAMLLLIGTIGMLGRRRTA